MFAKVLRSFWLPTDIANIVGCGEAEHPILAIDGDDHSTIGGVADRCSPKACVKLVGAKKEFERGPEYKDLRERSSSLHTRNKFA